MVNIKIMMVFALIGFVFAWAMSRCAYNTGYVQGWNEACERFAQIRRRDDYEARLDGEGDEQ